MAKLTNSDQEQKVRYFFDLWSNLAAAFPSPVRGFTLNGPHSAIQNLWDELQAGPVRNPALKRVFQGHVKRLADEPIVEPTIAHDVKLLARELPTDRAFVQRQLCEMILPYFTSGQFYSACLEALLNVLFGPQTFENATPELKKLAEWMLQELYLHGVDSVTLERIPIDVWDADEMIDERLYTSFPVPSEVLSSYPDDSQERNKALKEYMANLTGRDRVMAMKSYFRNELTVYKVIFQIRGLRSPGERSVVLSNVHFYNPHYHRELNGSSSEKETWGEEPQDELGSYINARAMVRAPDSRSAVSRGKRAVDEALDLLTAVIPPDVPYRISPRYHLIGDEQGKLVGSAWSAEKEDFLHTSVDLDAAYKAHSGTLTELGGRLYAASLGRVEEGLRQSLHWYRKGMEAPRPEDKLLNYWVAIEKPFPDPESMLYEILDGKERKARFNLIRRILPAIMAVRYRFHEGWNLYAMLKQMASSFTPTIPPSVAREVGLLGTEGSVIRLSDFIPHLEKLRDCISPDGTAFERLSHGIQFYSDPSYAVTCIEAYRENVEDNVSIIYWYRNRIVHDAHYEGRALEFFSAQASRYAATLFQTLNHAQGVLECESTDEVLSRVLLAYERFLMHMKSAKHTSVLDYDDPVIS